MSLFDDLRNPRDIDATVRLRLVGSLAHIFERAKSHLDIDPGRFEVAIKHIQTKKQDPGVFARYYDLIFAVTSNRIATANTLLDELIEHAARPAHFSIVPYTQQGLGPDYDRFPRLLFAEYSETNPMASPSEAQSTASTQMLREAIEIVSHVDKSIYDEIEALLARIYLATGSGGVSAKRFGGVTSFLVWGATFINIEAYKTPWDAVQFLVHEITHSLLFGLSFDEALVRNSPDENYKSPLRSDPRPMDGIFHATLVCARLADFNRTWLNCGLAAGADRDKSEEAIAENLRCFRDGVAVIDQFGKLSERGRNLIDRSCARLLVPA